MLCDIRSALKCGRAKPQRCKARRGAGPVVVLGAAGHADGADHAAILDDRQAAAEEDHPWTKCNAFAQDLAMFEGLRKAGRSRCQRRRLCKPCPWRSRPTRKRRHPRGGTRWCLRLGRRRRRPPPRPWTGHARPPRSPLERGAGRDGVSADGNAHKSFLSHSALPLTLSLSQWERGRPDTTRCERTPSPIGRGTG